MSCKGSPPPVTEQSKKLDFTGEEEERSPQPHLEVQDSLEAGSDLGICAAAWDHAWLSLRLLSETLKTNSYFFKTRHLFHFSSIGVFLKNAYACLTLGNLFLEFGFASVLRAFFCLFGIFKEDFVLTKYPRLTAPGNKSSDRAECLCHP